MNEFEEHAKDFLDYAAKNEKRLKKNLKKNVTFDEDIFDDVYYDSLVKVYDYIINKQKKIEDFEQFQFIVAKNHYILTQNKKRKRNETDDKQLLDDLNKFDDYFPQFDTWQETTEKEIYLDNINVFFKWLTSYLDTIFQAKETNLYMLYFKLKSQNRKISYKKLAEITNTNANFVAQTIQKLKNFVKNDETCKNKKEELLNEYFYD